MKTNKSVAKRIRVTKNGKVLARKAGHGHFNAKERRVKQLAKKGTQQIFIKKKTLLRFISV
jgi:ribosomal protein L35